MSMSYHTEARNKQDRLNRWEDQRRRAELGKKEVSNENPEDAAYKAKMDKVLSTDPGQFNQIRPPSLALFRVNQEGHNNRYQNRQHLNPHVDQVFAALYPGSDNPDYTVNDCQVHRRLNSGVDRYHVSKKVNGEFHVQLSRESTAVEQ